MAWKPEQHAFVVALDGPAASGKTTVGRAAARALGLAYFDTGLLYRALTWLALDRHLDPADAAGLVDLVDRAHLSVRPGPELDLCILADGRDIGAELHQPAVDGLVSVVAAHAAVRAALVPVQRAAIQPPGVVMAGRDIGTVIVPEAPLKIWLSASVEERARRRALQTGESYAAVLAGTRRRDLLDGSRSVAPMRKAPDAVEVVTDGLEPEAVVERIVALARQRLPGAPTSAQP